MFPPWLNPYNEVICEPISSLYILYPRYRISVGKFPVEILAPKFVAVLGAYVVLAIGLKEFETQPLNLNGVILSNRADNFDLWRGHLMSSL